MHTKIITVASAKTKVTGKFRPRLRLAGLWLNEIGFEYNMLLTITNENGNLVFKVQGKGTESYTRLVKGVLKNKSGLLQVRYAKANKINVPAFEVKGKWLEDLGFTIGSVVAVQYEHGVIRIRLLDLEKLAYS